MNQNNYNFCILFAKLALGIAQHKTPIITGLWPFAQHNAHRILGTAFLLIAPHKKRDALSQFAVSACESISRVDKCVSLLTTFTSPAWIEPDVHTSQPTGPASTK